ncbi:L,D-transpeptidase family protein [Halomonas koreensis]|uniref:L,D-transpeptidase family protein n=1 Tax=Halomonas koreensis TaxID=245385 RepID=A0ABU1G3C2_9GAMM|nr:L,D-transpeptidase family protein [Halomonas koreensis]MDR5867445.1 L,D-transpeptidase family protein [Halomonas koreensis]
MRTAATLPREISRWGMAFLILLVPVISFSDAGEARPGASSRPFPAAEAALERPPSPLAVALRGATPAVAAFHARRDGDPAWQSPARVAALVELLEALEDEGLSPADYRPARLAREARAALAPAAPADVRARFEVRASETLVRALGHLQRGRLAPAAVYPGWEIPVPPVRLDLAAIHRALAAGEVERALALARPDGERYAALRRTLIRYRRIARLGGWPVLPERRASLRPGDVHADVALLRRRLAMIGELEVMGADVGHYPGVELEAPASHRYGPGLVAAVRRFQRRHMLEDDGIVGPRTRAALNVPVERRLATLRANLERARWLSGERPVPHLRVDLAGQRIRYRRPGGETWESRVIVGQAGRPSPVLHSAITHFTLNPTWTVPPTILREDILPEVRRDPGYLLDHDMLVLTPQGRRLSPWGVDWWRPGPVILRQRAGPRNPLGRLVLRFPNDHLVYLHDTPTRGLFGRPRRTFSSGCIRVEGVLELGRMLFADTGTRRDLGALIATGRTRNVSLAREVPLALHYWTAEAEVGGLPSFRPDIYGRDPALIAALAGPPQA